MVLPNATTISTELDKLAAIEPDEDVLPYIKTLISRGEQVHGELHLTAYEGDYPASDTRAVRAALRG